MASCVFLSSLASFFSISRFRSQFALFGAMLNRSYSRVSSTCVVRGSNKDTDQLLSAFSTLLLNDLFRQSFYVLLHRVFHFNILIVSSFFERSRLGVEVPVLNEGLCILYSVVVRRQNRSGSSDLLTRPPPFLLFYAFVKRVDEPCGLARSLPKTLRCPGTRAWTVAAKTLHYGNDHVWYSPITRRVLVQTRR